MIIQQTSDPVVVVGTARTPIGAFQGALRGMSNAPYLLPKVRAGLRLGHAAVKDHDIPHDKVNIHGGACALGHPIGATGARLLVTLLSAMEQHHVKRGVAALCIGGGEATAVALERV